jgi:hypothetical protein
MYLPYLNTNTSLYSWGLAHPTSLTELALLDGRRPLPLWDVIGLTLTSLDKHSEFHSFKFRNIVPQV